MRREEARRVSALVLGLGLPKGSVCLNVGSSTRHFREVVQPHVSGDLIRPLEESGIQVIHCDLKEAAGVDLVGDVLDPGFQRDLADKRADVVLCCNLLEHLLDPHRFAAACGSLVRAGGHLVVSVPLSYPYHADPIDTMLRLTPAELASFFPGWKVTAAEVITAQTFLEETLEKRNGVAILLVHVLKVLVPFYRPSRWRGKAHRLLWLFRPYQTSLAVLRKPTDDTIGS